MGKINLALAQLRCNLFDKESNIHRVLETMSLAHKKEADYILFPELYITGYRLDEQVIHLAESLEGKNIKQIQESAKKYHLGVIIGLPEMDDGLIYNTAVFIDKNGEILGKYRKNHLFSHEKKLFSAGNECPVFETPEGKIGLMITYDMEFPEQARILAIKGAQLILILEANMIPYQSYQNIYLSARAMENHVFIAGVNKVGLEKDMVFFGESSVIHPTGKILYKSNNNEDLAVIKINLSETKHSKGLLDYIMNRRPDVYEKEGLLNKDYKF